MEVLLMTKSIHLTPKAEKLVYMLLFFYMGCFVGFMWELLLYWFNHDINFLTALFNLRGFCTVLGFPFMESNVYSFF